MNKKIVQKKIPLLLSLLIVVAISGCSSLEPPQQLTEELKLTEEISARYHVDQQWWEAYHDKQLNELVQTALDNNLDLAKSAISVNRALYQAKLIGADLVPAFSGGVKASTSKDLKHGGSSTDSYSGNIGVNYEFDLWRKLADSASAQKWEYQATVEDKEAARLTLINNVVDTYYHLVYIHNAIRITQSNITHYQKLQQLAQTRYSSGKTSVLPFEQAKQSLLSAQNTLLDLQSQQKTAEQTLRNLLNLKPSESLNLSYPDLLSVKSPGVWLDVPLSVLANRPDLKATEYRLQKAFKSAKASQKSWYPTITIGASVSSSSDKARTAFNFPFSSGNVSIDFPFLKWNTVKWNVKISESDYEKSRLDFEQSVTTALNEVDTYYYTYRQNRNTLVNLEKKYQADSKIAKYYHTRYINGANDLSDWLSALNTENSSRQSVLNARYQLLKYENLIYKSMAGRYTEWQGKP